ncbi:MAG TPA: hypothetical protein DDW52_02115 [Planctomycetaceae bacterium]|nr:hypothetical protein [Planctomycetaceae bacterium]
MEIQRLIGVPGSGKTTALLDYIVGATRSGIPVEAIGFSSFTRAALATIRRRVHDELGTDPVHLAENCWFRTLHSCAMRCCGVKPNKLVDSNHLWQSQAMECVVNPRKFDCDSGLPLPQQHNYVSGVLSYWDRCRLTLSPPKDADADFKKVIGRYELAKREDGKTDFADVLLRFCGLRMSTEELTAANPTGELPNIRTWYLDEYQDVNPLLHRVAQRLASAPSVERVVVAGDPGQSIYSFCGSSPAHLSRGWKYTEQRNLYQSHRCAPQILSQAESVLQPSKGYKHRRVESVAPDGLVDSTTIRKDELRHLVKARRADLIIARSNNQVRQLGKILTKFGQPWLTVAEKGGYLSRERIEASEGLWSLVKKGYATSRQWQLIIKQFSKLPDWRHRVADLPLDPNQTPNDETAKFIHWARHIDWRYSVLPHAAYLRAAHCHGAELASHPKLRIGTIHSTKGDEADNVLVYDILPTARPKSRRPIPFDDEERRVWYVAISRARESATFFRFDTDFKRSTSLFSRITRQGQMPKFSVVAADDEVFPL